jgi:hypothetical protein
MQPPVITSLSAAASGGTFTAGTYFYKVTATNASGESAAGVESSQTVILNGTITLNWVPVIGATGYRVYRGTSAGNENAYQVVAGGAVGTFTDTGTAGTGGTPPALSFSPVGLMNTADTSEQENVAEFDTFDSDDPIALQGKPKTTLTIAGYLGDADTGQLALLSAARLKQTVTLKFLWDGTNGFIQPVKVSAYKGGAKAGNQPVELSFDFTAASAIGTQIGTGPLL